MAEKNGRILIFSVDEAHDERDEVRHGKRLSEAIANYSWDRPIPVSVYSY
jgi:hypothetical protein